MSRHRVLLLGGDGIGPEVVDSADAILQTLEEAGKSEGFDVVRGDIGLAAYIRHGDALPQVTIDAALAADAVLHGATDGAGLPPGVPKPLRRLREILGAYAHVRPAIAFAGVPDCRPDIDVVIVREALEGLHCHKEFLIGDTAISLRIVTREGTYRVARKAFEIASQRRRSLTVVHKRGALPVGDGLWIEAVEEVAGHFPNVGLHLMNVDTAVHELIRHPAHFDVILAENSRGDILSDAALALTGGLGLGASGGYGDRHAYFEPVHGTAPDIVGRGTANPIATVLATAMLLSHLGETSASENVVAACRAVIRAGILTPDLGGTSTTSEVVGALRTQLLRT